jgi:hypothetical protein
MKNEGKCGWKQQFEDALVTIKMLLLLSTDSATADIYDTRHDTVQRNARDTGTGAVLFQDIDGDERLVEFTSRIVDTTEENY